MNMSNKSSWEKALHEGFVFPTLHRSMALPEAVRVITGAVAEHLLQSPAVRTFLEKEPKGRGTACPNSPLDELVRYAALQRAQIDKSDPVLNLAFIEKFIMSVFAFEREKVLVALRWVEDISRDEMAMFKDCAHLARAVDRLWAKWFETEAIPYQSLDKAGKKRYKEFVGRILAQYDYTVACDPEDSTDRQPWARAFPEEIARISDLLFHLEHECHEPKLAEYWRALRLAYECDNIPELEAVWTKVDRAWIAIPRSCRLIPVQGMESGYEHPFGVSPEFRLEVRTEDYRDLIDQGRTDTIEYTKAMGLSETVLTSLAQMLDRRDIAVFVPAIRGGVAMNFRYGGQTAPNRPGVATEGGRIFLDRESAERTAMSSARRIEKHCSRETAEILKDLPTAENTLIWVIHHECAHAVSRSKEIHEALKDDLLLLEEAKATTFGTLSRENKVPQGNLQIVANTLGYRVLLTLHQTMIDDEMSASYVRECLVAARTMLDAGVIKLTDEGVVVDGEKAMSRVWFEKLHEFVSAVITAYQAKDREALRELTDRYCDQTYEPVARLIEWVNRSAK